MQFKMYELKKFITIGDHTESTILSKRSKANISETLPLSNHPASCTQPPGNLTLNIGYICTYM